MSDLRLVADRRRGSKRRKKATFWRWLCNPQVLKALIAGARLVDSLARLAKELVRIISQHKKDQGPVFQIANAYRSKCNMINDALRMIRVFHDIPQKDLAARLKIAPSYLSEIESGKKQPTFQLLESYAEQFKMPLSSIMFFSEQMKDGAPDRLRLNISTKVIALLRFIAARAERAGSI